MHSKAQDTMHRLSSFRIYQPSMHHWPHPTKRKNPFYSIRLHFRDRIYSCWPACPTDCISGLPSCCTGKLDHWITHLTNDNLSDRPGFPRLPLYAWREPKYRSAWRAEGKIGFWTASLADWNCTLMGFFENYWNARASLRAHLPLLLAPHIIE